MGSCAPSLVGALCGHLVRTDTETHVDVMDLAPIAPFHRTTRATCGRLRVDVMESAAAKTHADSTDLTCAAHFTTPRAPLLGAFMWMPWRERLQQILVQTPWTLRVLHHFLPVRAFCMDAMESAASGSSRTATGGIMWLPLGPCETGMGLTRPSLGARMKNARPRVHNVHGLFFFFLFRCGYLLFV